MATARQLADGKVVKKTRPRRTVDYNDGLGRWALVSYERCTSTRCNNPNDCVIPTPYSCENIARIRLMYRV
ncbi:hypothetical protein EV401DRAFT_1938833 [Pisolithus croceorrhizus]|nr:hypothetical protein EV401DRAFT_1938833 [Pisolithus croceorrhizus]